jgi:hypothetical protein
MYLRMKSKVLRFCEQCMIITMHCFVASLGLIVLTAIGFAIYQAIGVYMY